MDDYEAYLCPDCGECRGICQCKTEIEPWDYDNFVIPWCEEHQCNYELTFRDPPGYEFYACPECESERGEALGLI